MENIRICLLILSFTVRVWSSSSEEGLSSSLLLIRIFQEGIPNNNLTQTSKIIRLVEGSVLNLTCSVHDKAGRDVSVSWYVPSVAANSQHRIAEKGWGGERGRGSKERNLVISPVGEADSGNYVCEAISKGDQTHLKEVVKVVVEPDWGSCTPGFYHCSGSNSNKLCIPVRYRCDGRKDCPQGDDESTFPCGTEACKGKISCPELDFRCIDPNEFCCDPDTNFNCKILYPCCKAVLEYSILNQGGRAAVQQVFPQQSYYDKISYIAIGCCLALLLVILCVFLVHKYQGAVEARRQAGRRQRPPITLHDLDLMYGGEEERGSGAEEQRNFSITFNINHGVQILRPPPPYSAGGRTGLHRGLQQRGPPPPYRSNENLAEPLLMMAENNNNGDINGNSNMEDNNNVAANRNIAAAAAAAAANVDRDVAHRLGDPEASPPLDRSTPSPLAHRRPPLPRSFDGLNRRGGDRYSDTTNTTTSTETEEEDVARGHL